MIIFGMNRKFRVIGTGEFFCPHCQRPRPYEHKRGRNYLSLYFIPILAMGDAGEFIECQSCGMSYNLDVLNFKPERPNNDVNQLLNRVKRMLERGMPIEYVISDLTAERLDRDIAFNTVRLVTGGEQRSCPRCGLTYATWISECPACRVPLDEAQLNQR